MFLFLYEQFDPRLKFANFYFLVICILQSLDSISITNGYPASINALSFVILVQLVLTLKETVSRCSNDKRTNSREIGVFEIGSDGGTDGTQSGMIVTRTWADVRIGDVVKVNRGEFFPADLVLLATSNTMDAFETEGVSGSCFINTQNLDGETNHKIRKVPHLRPPTDGVQGQCAPKDTAAHSASSVAALAMKSGWGGAELHCESFNSSTSEFTATAAVGGAGSIPLSIDNLLLRGCLLVDCEWVLGVAVAVGRSSKCLYRGPTETNRWCSKGKGGDGLKLVRVYIIGLMPDFALPLARSTVAVLSAATGLNP